MSTFTSNLPDELLEKLALKAKALSLPKNKLIEAALKLYLDHLERAEYIISEEGMMDYLNQLDL